MSHPENDKYYEDLIESIKPCPFCGDIPNIEGINGPKWIQCSCGVETQVFNTPEQAIDMWNTRKGE